MEKAYNKLNKYLADLVVFHVKLHDLHWNVKGKQFVEVHKFTEAIYEETAEKFDAVAERMIMSGVKPASSLKDYLALSDIKEVEGEAYTVDFVLNEVLNDLKLLRDACYDMRKDFEEIGKVQEVNLLDGDIEGYDKNIWFLEAMLAE